MANIGTLVATLGADVTGLKRGMREGAKVIRDGTKKMSTNINNARRSILNLNNAMLGMAMGFVAKRVIGSFIEVASGFEAMQVKLDALTDGRGVETLERINEWAIKMPVNTREAVDAFVLMQAMGLEPTIDKMQILTDVASIFGDEVLGRVALALGQMSTLGRVSAQDLNQLAQAGINARKYLREAFGMTVEEFQKSGKAVEEAVNVIWKGMEDEFGGSALRMMNSWRGLVTTLKSGIVEIQRFIMDAGVFEALKEQLIALNKATFEWLENNKELIKIRVPEYIEAVRNTVKDLTPALRLAADALMAVGRGLGAIAHLGKAASNTFRAMNLAMEGVLDWGEFARMNFEELGAYLKELDRSTGLVSLKKQAKEASRDIVELVNDIAKVNQLQARGMGDYSGALKILNDRLELARDKLKLVNAEMTKMAKTEVVIEVRTATMESDVKDFLRHAHNYRLQMTKETNDQVASMEAYTADEIMKLHIQAFRRVETETMEIWKEMTRERLAEERQFAINAAQSLRDARVDISLEDYFGDLDEMQLKMEDKFAIFEQLSERTAWAMQENFSSVFFDAMEGRLNSFQDVFDSFATSIKKIMADLAAQFVTQWAFGKLAGATAGGGFLSKIFGTAGTAHSGARVGVTRMPQRKVAASAFIGAPRLHEGLRANEMPVILEHGEDVRTKKQRKADEEAMWGTTVVNNFYTTVESPTGTLPRNSLTQLQSMLGKSMAIAVRRNG